VKPVKHEILARPLHEWHGTLGGPTLAGRAPADCPCTRLLGLQSALDSMSMPVECAGHLLAKQSTESGGAGPLTIEAEEVVLRRMTPTGRASTIPVTCSLIPDLHRRGTRDSTATRPRILNVKNGGGQDTLPSNRDRDE